MSPAHKTKHLINLQNYCTILQNYETRPVKQTNIQTGFWIKWRPGTFPIYKWNNYKMGTFPIYKWNNYKMGTFPIYKWNNL
jgi:hypothetical protein